MPRVTANQCKHRKSPTASNVQRILLAAGRRTQAGDATEQWRDQWRRRLECVIQQQGGHTEHLVQKL